MVNSWSRVLSFGAATLFVTVTASYALAESVQYAVPASASASWMAIATSRPLPPCRRCKRRWRSCRGWR